jgi:ribosomal protein S18 acetylase RimI-like enzyme
LAAADHLGAQFDYQGTVDMGERHPWHVMVARAEGQEIGHMHWNNRHIGSLEVEPEYRRQGVATGMWQEAQRLAETNKNVPAPQHSSDRTNMGTAWAKAVGGRLPRRKRDAD